MSINRYDKGDWNAICDSCGMQVKASTLRKRWDGLMVCHKDWEPRQTQDFVKAVLDIQAPPFTRPVAGDSFIGGFCATRTSVVGLAIAGCAIAGYIDVVGTVPSSSFTS